MSHQLFSRTSVALTALLSLMLTFFLLAMVSPLSAFATSEANVDTMAENAANQAIERLEQAKAVGAPQLLTYNAGYNLGYEQYASITPFSLYSLPASFDLRHITDQDLNYVTSVKSQEPWGTCWAFGAIAASETSLLYEADIPVTPGNELDLSELHLASFIYHPLTDGPQIGEGLQPYNYYVDTPLNDPHWYLDIGGWPYMASYLFPSGIGPALESDAPYETGKGDWNVDESVRFKHTAELEEGRILPTPASLFPGPYGLEYSYNEHATEILKREIMAGRAIAMGIFGDSSMPDNPSWGKQYINTDTWAQYTDDANFSNHIVTIVGWDDNYGVENFITEPPAPGAWIAKNSWGSLKDDGTGNNWGVDGSGYFYISYYDESLSSAETFDFDVESFTNPQNTIIHQHDFMPCTGATAQEYADYASMANVFTAAEDQNIKSVSCHTIYGDTRVTFRIYLLDESFDDETSSHYHDIYNGRLLGTYSTSYDNGGYHRFELPEPIGMREGEKFAIEVQQQEAHDFYLTIQPYELNESGVKYVNEYEVSSFDSMWPYFAKGIVNENESFQCNYDANSNTYVWADWADIVAKMKAETREDMISQEGYDTDLYDYDNFNIKAYGIPTELDPRPDFEPDVDPSLPPDTSPDADQNIDPDTDASNNSDSISGEGSNAGNAGSTDSVDENQETTKSTIYSSSSETALPQAGDTNDVHLIAWILLLSVVNILLGLYMLHTKRMKA